MKKQRKSWMDVYREFPRPPGVSESQATQNTLLLDNLLHEEWHFAKRLILLWAPVENGMLILSVPYWQLVEHRKQRHNHAASEGDQEISQLLSRDRMVDEEEIRRAARVFGSEPVHLSLPFTPGEGLNVDLISALVRRYGVSLVTDRAVILLDAVGFSLLSPIAQVTQLNSLSYSVNSAYNMLLSKSIDIAFSRSNTGDGFYIWNKDTGVRANVDLYHFLLLILAHNAIARAKSSHDSVPLLRSCFHVGDHYEFFQEESLSPTRFTYLVGDVTIELARMIENARPGQILIGDFRTPMAVGDREAVASIGTIDFIDKAREMVFHLDEIDLCGDQVTSIACYLTGPKSADGAFRVARYGIQDKHGLSHRVFNAKINLTRRAQAPIYLGLVSPAADGIEGWTRDVLG